MKSDYFTKILNNKNARLNFLSQLDRLIALLKANNQIEAALDYIKTKDRISNELALLDDI